MRQHASGENFQRSAARVHAMSRNADWQTPPALFARLHAEFAFTIDVAASRENALCPEYLTIEDDALTVDWGKHVCFMNPPYGREIARWMAKAFDAKRGGGNSGLSRPRAHRHNLVACVC